jgi:hypothetical protein
MRMSYLKALETQAKWFQWLMRPHCGIDEPSYLLVMSKWYEVLKDAETLYMGKEFCSLVDIARRTVPDDLQFEDSWVPCEKGFLYLETPFAVPRAPRLPVHVTIRAVGWMPNAGGTLFLFALEGNPGTNAQGGFASWSYCTLYNGEPVLARLRYFEEQSKAASSLPEPPYAPGKEMDELHEIRWLYTALHLMSQKLAVTRKEGTSPLARSLNRSKGRKINDDLRIVSLRRMEYDPQQEQGEHSDREFQWQWVVTGHWRRQPYRDGVYKNIFIEAFVKGPQTMPLKPPVHKIYVAVR